MRLKDLSTIRLFSQKIAKSEFGSATELVRWMGAMQAQDFRMATIAVAMRTPDSSNALIDKAFNNGEIIRTHIMRPTWHFVAAEDVHWMRELTAPQVKSAMRSRHRQLGFTDDIYSKSQKVIETALIDGNCMTREELEKEFSKAGILTSDNRLVHLLLCAELNGTICSGPLKNRKQTFSLLECRVPFKKFLSREESLAELAKRYFRSHGPATIADFVWWSGLPAKDAKTALEIVKTNLSSVKLNSKEYWFDTYFETFKSPKTSVHLLPAYDEFLISYRDRSASLGLTGNRNVISSNGIFRPVIIINGQVAGLWNCSVKDEKLNIRIGFLKAQNKLVMKLTENAAVKIGGLFGLEVRIS